MIVDVGNDLRHTFASRLVMAGVDIRSVQELMGHKTIQVTMRYAHLTPRHQLEAVQRLCNTGLTQNAQLTPKLAPVIWSRRGQLHQVDSKLL